MKRGDLFDTQARAVFYTAHRFWVSFGFLVNIFFLSMYTFKLWDLKIKKPDEIQNLKIGFSLSSTVS